MSSVACAALYWTPPLFASFRFLDASPFRFPPPLFASTSLKDQNRGDQRLSRLPDSSKPSISASADRNPRSDSK